MKKSLIFAGAIFFTSGIAIAKTIGFNTPIKWNSKVIEEALKVTGFKPKSSVGPVYNRILKALLELDTFSARQAVEVCMEECNKSKMLKEGQGNSGKKCPQLCEEFASSLVIANNTLLTGNTESQTVGYNMQYSWKGAAYITGTRAIDRDVIITFKDEEHSSKEFCKILTADALKRGLKYPMKCGGKCQALGQDIIEVTGSDYAKTLYYEVGDFCDGLFESAGVVHWRVHFDGTMEKLKN
ncbi:MAG: hypothetical protein IJX89_00925 [Alphaproteobacteria bacterium]|nr:hypothetical protein [Alphaproteobacteria bacterium]